DLAAPVRRTMPPLSTGVCSVAGEASYAGKCFSRSSSCQRDPRMISSRQAQLSELRRRAISHSGWQWRRYDITLSPEQSSPSGRIAPSSLSFPRAPSASEFGLRGRLVFAESRGLRAVFRDPAVSGGPDDRRGGLDWPQRRWRLPLRRLSLYLAQSR